MKKKNNSKLQKYQKRKRKKILKLDTEKRLTPNHAHKKRKRNDQTKPT